MAVNNPGDPDFVGPPQGYTEDTTVYADDPGPPPANTTTSSGGTSDYGSDWYALNYGDEGGSGGSGGGGGGDGGGGFDLGSLINAALGLFGANKQSKGIAEQNAIMRLASDRAEAARQQAMLAMGDPRTTAIGNMLFPGIFPRGGPTATATPTTNATRSPRILGGGGEQSQAGPKRKVGDVADNPWVGYAKGGPMSSGQPYMVGEEGPEVVVPKEDGQVIPNPATDGGEALLKMVVVAILKFLQERGDGGAMGAGGMEGMMGGAEGMPPDSAGPPLTPDMLDSVMKETRARGGPVRAGQPYTVGEQGPEVVVPAPGAPPPQPQPTPMPTPVAGQKPGAPAAQPPVAQPPATQAGPQKPNAPGNPVMPNPASPPLPGGFQHPGAAANAWTMEYFNNPGRLSPITYERAQAQANQGLTAGIQANVGRLSGAGADPNSGMGVAMNQATAGQAGAARNKAAQEYSLAQEALRRADVATAFQNYITELDAIFGLQRSQAQAAGGQAFPTATALNANAPYAQALATLNEYLATLWSDNGQNNNTGGGNGGGGGGNNGPNTQRE